MPKIALGNKSLPKSLPAHFYALSQQLPRNSGPFGGAPLIKGIQEFFEIRQFLTQPYGNKFEAEVCANNDTPDNPTVALKPELGPTLESDFSAMIGHFNRTFTSIIAQLNPYVRSRLADGEEKIGIVAKTYDMGGNGPCLVLKSGGGIREGWGYTAGAELTIFPEKPLEAFLRLVRYSSNYHFKNHPCQADNFDTWAPLVLDQVSELLGANPWAALLGEAARDNEKGFSVCSFLWGINPQEQLQKFEASVTPHAFPGGIYVSPGKYRRLQDIWFYYDRQVVDVAECNPTQLVVLQPDLVDLPGD